MSTCNTCKYFAEPTNQCRINPPNAAIVGFDQEKLLPMVVSVFPSVRPIDDWCGKHVPNLAIAN